MPAPYITFGAPFFGEPELRAVTDVMRSGWVGSGPKVQQFERAVAQYVRADYGVAVNSCTAALHLSLLVGGVQPGDEVITTAMTFGATANAIVHAGARPVLVDCDRRTQLIDVEHLARAITPRTRAIVPVHLCGRVCDLQAITALARQHNLFVVEDAAHALEAATGDRKIGSISDFTCFSFYVTKNITTVEGGMVTTNDPDHDCNLRLLALHGLTRDAWRRYSDVGFRHYEIAAAGYKYNMTDLQAAIGLQQFTHIEAWLRRRAEIWEYYTRAFAHLPIDLPLEPESDTVHARHLYTVMVDAARTGIGRDDFMQQLHLRGIGSGVHYVGVHLQPYYREKFGCCAEDFPNATWISERTVSLPLSPHLSDDDVERVVGAVKQILR